MQTQQAHPLVRASLAVSLDGYIAASGALGPMPPTSYPTFVPTHRPMPKPPRGYGPFGGTPSELVNQLRTQLVRTGKGVWHMGGGESIESFRADGLIDRLELSDPHFTGRRRAALPTACTGPRAMETHQESRFQEWRCRSVVRAGAVNMETTD
jgi:riboflavin biosynthesis pyrimidine reductase